MREVKLAVQLGIGLMALMLPGCTDTCDCENTDIANAETGLVRGRVRLADGGRDLERVTVRVAGQSARTDRFGMFELEVVAGETQRLQIDDPRYAGGETSVRVQRGGETSVDLSVLRMGILDIADAEDGGRLEDDEGFAVEMPAGALRTRDGKRAEGVAEMRYAVVTDPSRMRVPPDLRARDAAGDDVRLRSFGMLEVRFYQEGEQLTFEGEVEAELPLPEESSLRNGDERDVYRYDTDSLRWERGETARVRQGKWVMSLTESSWWTAAEVAEELSCVSASLQTPGGEPAEGSVVTAVGRSELWLSAAVTDEDGQVCVEAPAETELVLSAFVETDEEFGEWSATTTTPEDSGMCGGDDCAELGEQSFEGGPLPGSQDGGAGTDDSGAGSDDGGAGTDDGGTGGVPAFGGLMDSMTSTMPGEAVTFRFTAVGGELAAYTVSSTSDATADVRVLNPDGDALSGAGSSVGAGSSTFEDAFRLPEVAGSYAIEITPRNEGQGTFTLDLFGVPEDDVETLEVDGAAVTLSLDAIAQNGQISFDATGGERLAYTVSSTVSTTSDLSLDDPQGDAVSGAGTSVTAGGDAFEDLFLLPEVAGTYTFALDPRMQGTGSLTLRVFSVPADDSQTIAIGDAATASMAGVAQNAEITFEATGGERLAYTLSSTATTLVDVSLRDPVGTTVAGSGDTVSGGSDAFRDSFTLPAIAGTYTFSLNPRQQGTGNVTLTLLAVPADTQAATIIDEGPTSVTTTAVGQNAVYTFTAGGGERLAYTLASTANALADVALTDPNGGSVPGAGMTVSGGNSEFSDEFRLPAVAGSYTLSVDPRGQGLGGFTLDLFGVPEDASTEPTPLSNFAGSSEVPLTVQTPGQNAFASYTSVAAGARVAYFVTNDADTLVDTRLVAPSGAAVSGSGRTTGALTSQFQDVFTLPNETGTYTLEIDPRTQGTGSVRVRLYEVTPEVVGGSGNLDASPVAANIAIPGQRAEVSFTLGAGTPFTFTVTSDAGTVADVDLFDPSGDVVAGTGVGTVSATGSRTSDPLNAAEAGTYTLSVDPRTDGLNSFVISIDSP